MRGVRRSPSFALRKSCTSCSTTLGRGWPTGRAVTRASSSSGRARETPPRWSTSSSSTSSRSRSTAAGRSEQRAKRGADAGDDHAGERDAGEGADERVREELPAEIGESEQLAADHRDCREERDVVVRDEKRQRVEDPAEE